MERLQGRALLRAMVVAAAVFLAGGWLISREASLPAQAQAPGAGPCPTVIAGSASRFVFDTITPADTTVSWSAAATVVGVCIEFDGGHVIFTANGSDACYTVTGIGALDGSASERQPFPAGCKDMTFVTVHKSEGTPPTPSPSPSPSPTPPSAKIVPTGTTCEQFRGGSASDTNRFLYRVRNGLITNVADPGAAFYFASVTAPAASFTVTIQQSDTGTPPPFGMPQVQVYTRSDCQRYQNVSVSITGSGALATINVTGASAGQQFILRASIDPQTVVGAAAPSPSIVTYTYLTRLNGTLVGGSTDTVRLEPRP